MKKSVFYDYFSENYCNKNPVRDMKNVSKCFVVSETFPIFAPAILEKTSGNALFDILHDRLTSFDLVKSGKFQVCREDVSFSFRTDLITKNKTMALFRITVKQKVRTNGIVLDPGMQVEVVTQSYSDPVHTNGGQVVADAFMRIYGVDIKKAGALNGIYLDVKQIG